MIEVPCMVEFWSNMCAVSGPMAGNVSEMMPSSAHASLLRNSLSEASVTYRPLAAKSG